MSEMDFGSDEAPLTATDRLHAALVDFTGCIGSALEEVCSYGLTIGDTYVPFDLDEDEECEDFEEGGDDVSCTQAWVRVMSVTPKPGGPVYFDGSGWSQSLVLTLEAGVLRCIETPEEGEAFSTTDVLTGALQSMTDMHDILCAAMSCGMTEDDPDEGVWDAIEVGVWTPMGPLGGQYGGAWTFTVEFAGTPQGSMQGL